MFHENFKTEKFTSYLLHPGGVAAGDRGGDLAGRPLCKQVSELLGRVVASSTARGDARMWEVYARFNEGAGR